MLVFRPERPWHVSPGQRPGLAIQKETNALKGHRTNLRCPFRAMFGCVRVTWGGVHPHSRIHLPQTDMLCPGGAKRYGPA